MKKIIFLIAIILMCSINVLYPHNQHVHQYITIEGYKLLKMAIGADVPQMVDHLDYNCNAGTKPWELRYLTTGAWREDEEDVVYHYAMNNPPLLTGGGGILNDALAPIIGQWEHNKWFESITHFWKADRGDNVPSDIWGSTIGIKWETTVPNAYQKLKMYAYPNRGWRIDYMQGGPTSRYERRFTLATGQTIYVTHMGTIGFEYYSLADLYTTGRAWITGYNSVPNGDWVSCNYEIRFEQGWRDVFVWEILGRMAHLLQDMSVPAHSHCDEHGSDPTDAYENYFGTNFYWDATLVNNQFGGALNPYVESDPLHFLMYTTSQIADHFGSSGPYDGDGNSIIGGNPLPSESAFLNGVRLSELGEPTGMKSSLSDAEKMYIRDKTFPQAIRATAGLLYWFAKETGLTSTILNEFTVNTSRNFENLYIDPLTQLSALQYSSINVQTPANLVYNGKTYSFARWSDNVPSNSRSFFSSANVQAIYKLVQNSASQNAFANNGQRKFIRTPDGYYHLVYESMGNIWYERSVDGGITWTIENNGKPLNTDYVLNRGTEIFPQKYTKS